MTSDEYATLMDFLATRFARIDARFDRIEARMDALEGRMGALEGRMGALEERMGALEGRMGALEGRMDVLEGRTGALEGRLTRSEVLWESMRDDIRRVAEGVVAMNERLDRFQDETVAHFDSLERRLGGIQVQFDRFAVDFGTVQLDHGARIVALDRWRKGRGREG